MHAGLTCSTYFPGLVASAKPFFTLFSLLDTCACVGASLASNSATARSAVGVTALLPVRAALRTPYHFHSPAVVMFVTLPAEPMCSCYLHCQSMDASACSITCRDCQCLRPAFGQPTRETEMYQGSLAIP